MTLQVIFAKMKREINAKSEETGKLRTVRMSKLAEIVEELDKNKSEAAKKAVRILQRDINHSYSQQVPPRRGELIKAYEVLRASLNKEAKVAKTSKKAA